MEKLKTTDVKKILDVMADTAIENEQYFCKLDAAAGDGDFGSTLAKGFKIIKENLEENSKYDIGELLKSSGMLIMKSCGGATGSLWGSAFRSAGKSAKGKAELTAVECREVLNDFCGGMKKVGGAEVGDKTLIDALDPAIKAMERSIEKGVKDIDTLLEEAEKAAADGAERTKEIIAKKGRATYLGKRSIGYPDAGAVAVSMMFKDVNNKLFRS
ncbi:MAG: dihydroxyacetone kinase subunit L [Spirochaetales bacterium]|nr:dihydroxyacetone kinase subunit L [Spirochaetales bacterium]